MIPQSEYSSKVKIESLPKNPMIGKQHKELNGSDMGSIQKTIGDLLINT
jgi:hypothetical protein